MSARAPRRNFATPLVITLAALPGCAASNAPPPVVVVNGAPAPGEPAAAPAAEHAGGKHTNPPRPQPAAGEQRWFVSRSGDGCMAMQHVECPRAEPGYPAPTCNPPAPTPYACPDAMGTRSELTIVRYAGTAACVIQPEKVSCPPHTTCNPPRPRSVPCPGQ